MCLLPLGFSPGYGPAGSLHVSEQLGHKQQTRHRHRLVAAKQDSYKRHLWVSEQPSQLLGLIAFTVTVLQSKRRDIGQHSFNVTDIQMSAQPHLLSNQLAHRCPVPELSVPSVRVVCPCLQSVPSIRVVCPCRLSVPSVRAFCPCLLSTVCPVSAVAERMRYNRAPERTGTSGKRMDELVRGRTVWGRPVRAVRPGASRAGADVLRLRPRAMSGGQQSDEIDRDCGTSWPTRSRSELPLLAASTGCLYWPESHGCCLLHRYLRPHPSSRRLHLLYLLYCPRRPPPAPLHLLFDAGPSTCRRACSSPSRRHHFRTPDQDAPSPTDRRGGRLELNSGAELCR